MVENASVQIRDLSPPGEILREALDERGISNAELSRRTGLSEKHISQIINARVPLSMDVALQLERVLGIPARLWNGLEFNYRSEVKRREQRRELSQFAEWMRRFPIRDMVKRGYIRQVGHGAADRVEALLNFFGVTSPDAWQEQWEHISAQFRSSRSFHPDQYALSAWLRYCDLLAQRIRTTEFDGERFREVVDVARTLTTSGPKEFRPRLQEVCANAGVALVLAPSLPRLAVSGATKWLGHRKALLALSLRHLSDDQFWFSFFHEAFHVLRHRTSAVYIDSKDLNPDDAVEELRANEFARDTLIPPDRYSRFTESGRITLRRIAAFARELGIAPGIVVGRLQFEGKLPHTDGNKLKKYFRWV